MEQTIAEQPVRFEKNPIPPQVEPVQRAIPAPKTDAGALTQEQIDAFTRDGYLPYKKILSDAEIELLRQEYDAEFARAETGGQWRNLSAAEGASVDAQKSAKTKMLQIMGMGERNIHYRKLLYDARILDVVQDLMGPNIMLFHDQALFKPAFHGGEVTWHQDNAYWHARPANLVSCWLTLDDVDESNGAMQVIPGSHLAPVWHEKKNEADILFNLEDQIDKSKAVTVSLPAGACMFHHCQTLHHTNPNTTPRQRRAFAIHMMMPGTRNSAGVVFRPDFHHSILRMTI
jgi:ectoine hydroxylase-related dioxygenase (phytanoyl-CoA dioxygenase family)